MQLNNNSSALSLHQQYQSQGHNSVHNSVRGSATNTSQDERALKQQIIITNATQKVMMGSNGAFEARRASDFFRSPEPHTQALFTPMPGEVH